MNNTPCGHQHRQAHNSITSIAPFCTSAPHGNRGHVSGRDLSGQGYLSTTKKRTSSPHQAYQRQAFLAFFACYGGTDLRLENCPKLAGQKLVKSRTCVVTLWRPSQASSPSRDSGPHIVWLYKSPIPTVTNGEMEGLEMPKATACVCAALPLLRRQTDRSGIEMQGQQGCVMILLYKSNVTVKVCMVDGAEIVG